MPIIEMYQKELVQTELGLINCVFSFTYDKIPPRFYHELDECGLIGKPICHNSSLGFTFSSGSTYSEVLVTLK